MVKIRAFQGLLFNCAKINDIRNVVAPPYDVVDGKLREILYRNSKYNIVRLTLNKDPNPYHKAGELLEQWIKRKILIFDKDEAIYFYTQRFRFKGKHRIRHGFIALLKLDKAGILFHEDTAESPKQDRYQLLEKVKANLSPIFCLFSDPKKLFIKNFYLKAEKEILWKFYFQGVEHNFYRCRDYGLIAELKKFIKDKNVMIADGHHRYEVALNYRSAKRVFYLKDSPLDWILVYFSSLENESLNVFATHRVICANIHSHVFFEKIKKIYPLKKIKKIDLLRELEEDRGKIGIYCNSSFYVLKYNKEKERCGVIFLERNLLKKFRNFDFKLAYTPDPKKVVKLVNKSKDKIGILLPHPDLRMIWKMAEEGKRMPNKTTYFYPKILAGLVIYKF